MGRVAHGPHTYAEILSQPETWKQTLQTLPTSFPRHSLDIAAYEQIVFTGCGSTYYLSQWAARQCQQQQGIAVSAVPASEILLFSDAWLRPGRRTLLVAVSRSGQTSETLRAVDTFCQGGYGDVLAVTCYPESPLPNLTRWRILTPAAQEEGVAQTRSFTSMMLAVAWLIDGEISSSDAQMLASAASEIIQKHESLARTLGDNTRLSRFFFLGSGPYYGLACEAMLKMKEISLSSSEAYHLLEFRHGPMSMVDDHTLVIALLSDSHVEYQLDVLRDMRALGATTLALVAQGAPAISKAADFVITFDGNLSPAWRAPLYLPVLQLTAYYRAIAKGLDPDHPAHLEAVVTLDKG